jgi:hypothetical protein
MFAAFVISASGGRGAQDAALSRQSAWRKFVPDKPQKHSPEAINYAFAKANELLVAGGFTETAAILSDCKPPEAGAQEPVAFEEQLARAIRKARGFDADTLYQHLGDDYPIDSTDSEGRTFYKSWRKEIPSVRAVLAALPASHATREALEEICAGPLNTGEQYRKIAQAALASVSADENAKP